MQTSDPEKIREIALKVKAEIEKELRDRLPRKVGVKAIGIFKRNFHDSGFHNGSLTPWQKAQRQLSTKGGINDRRKTLTSARNHLMNSIQYRVGIREISVENPVPYAAIHNNGGIIQINPIITPKMRKFAWAMMYKFSRKKRKNTTSKKRRNRRSIESLSPEAQKWRALALTKKTHMTIRARMPKRQFIGGSKEISEMVQEEMQGAIARVSKIIEQYK